MIAIDTTPLVAMCDPRDEKHLVALADLARLVSQPLGICEAVLTEACFHLAHRSQRLRLRDLLDELTISVFSETSDETFRRDAFKWLIKYADHEPDWADACMAVLSSRYRRLKVWTYDGEFRTTWRRLDGTTIPLAVK